MDKKKIKDLIHQHREILSKNKVGSVYLFGSYVRNEQREDSDIDLLVEFKENSYKNFINLIFSLESLFNKEVTVVTPNSISPYIKPYVMKEAEKIEG
ncbi:MAG: nucleotidyltransferase family protein [Candidatus Margulisbacteria bacterium]|nr:nucleotidyltransferase family protein [Candidatus Margulisiibacteriota bacterium]